MSIRIVNEEIERFLMNKTQEVLCIKGKWGIGKTYAWNEYLKKAIKNNKLEPNKHAYVSLFGLNSLDEVKFALFESTITGGGKDLKIRPDLDSLKNNFNWIKKFYRKSVALASQNPFVQSYLGKSEKQLFFLVRDQIVCIDDIERVGKDLDIKDVFGLISYLKEQRNCKVVLILHDEEIKSNKVAEYKKLLEKVVDTVLDFNPTAEEASDIVFPNPKGIALEIRNNSITLGITNIRVIKKIERIVSRFEDIFGKDSKLMIQVAHSSALFVWSICQPDIAPTIDFLKDSSRLYGFGHKKDASNQKENDWRELIRAYGYTSTDEFDDVILETIEKGYFDKEKLNASGKRQLANIDQIGAKKEFDSAWDLYHNSFDNNEKEVLDTLCKSAKKASKSIEPINLDSIVVLLKEFNRTKDAEDLIKDYIQVRGNENDLFNFEMSIFSRDIKDPDLILAFKAKRESLVDSRNPIQVLEDIYNKHVWNPKDVVLLGKLSVDDFYKIFKETKDVKLHRIIKVSLDFGRSTDATSEMKAISDNAILALQKIGGENKLNRKRVSAHGVNVL